MLFLVAVPVSCHGTSCDNLQKTYSSYRCSRRALCVQVLSIQYVLGHNACAWTDSEGRPRRLLFMQSMLFSAVWFQSASFCLVQELLVIINGFQTRSCMVAKLLHASLLYSCSCCMPFRTCLFLLLAEWVQPERRQPHALILDAPWLVHLPKLFLW